VATGPRVRSTGWFRCGTRWLWLLRRSASLDPVAATGFSLASTTVKSEPLVSSIPPAATRAQSLQHAFESRLALGYVYLESRAFEAAMAEFEVAHILGQSHTLRHLRSHVAMLRWGWQAQSRREIAGQLARLAGAALFTWLWVPMGNPGSTRVGAFTPQPIPEELAELLQSSKS
jgi:hypothetical protein